MKAKLITTFVASIMLVACASNTPSYEEARAADYGAYPDNWKTLIKERTTNSLLDPESVQYKFNYSPPHKSWRKVQGDKGMFSTDIEYGWQTCFQYNAKNRLGGYVGFKDVYVLFKNGRVTMWDSQYGSIMCRNVTDV